MRTINTNQYYKRHAQMIQLQQETYPFTPTMREIMNKWGIKSLAHAFKVLQCLVNMGIVLKRNRHYYAIDNPEARYDKGASG